MVYGPAQMPPRPSEPIPTVVDDPLAPARGVILAVLLGGGIWAGLIALVVRYLR